MAGLKYWVWLNECRGLTNRSRALLLDHFGSPEDVYYADEAEYALVEGLSKKQFELLADKSTDGADKILGDCQRLGLRILTMQDADYPARLRGIFEPPCLLYVKGTLPAFDEEVAVAMVGTRACTPYGTQSVVVRNTPSNSYDAVAMAEVGDEVRVIGTKGDYYYVLLDDGSVGCLSTSEAN